jgi:hypothetical protein
MGYIERNEEWVVAVRRVLEANTARLIRALDL